MKNVPFNGALIIYALTRQLIICNRPRELQAGKALPEPNSSVNNYQIARASELRLFPIPDNWSFECLIRLSDSFPHFAGTIIGILMV